KDPFFKSFVVNHTNAATIINEDFKDTEDLNGVFSGLMQSKGGVAEWPFNGFINQYDGATWQYARTKAGAQGQGAAATAQSGETKVSTGPDGTKAPATPARCCNFCWATSAGRVPALWRFAATLRFKVPRIFLRSTTRSRVIWRRRRRSRSTTRCKII